MIDRAGLYGGLVWLVAAICAGLFAAETKKRRFWVWVFLSLLTGPIAWYLLVARLGIAVPSEVAVECPHCHRRTRSDLKRCIHAGCRRLLIQDEKDRAAQMGQTAATMVFTARRLFGNARKVAVEQQR